MSDTTTPFNDCTLAASAVTAEQAAQVDHFFLLTMGCFIFLMQAGFAFLEAGSVRAKNTTNILIKNFLDTCFGCLAYWAFGWAFAYGDLGEDVPVGAFVGFREFFTVGMSQDKFSTWFFQFTFAATTATITSGAMAERADFRAYLAYTIVSNGLVYPAVSHWVWSSEGWLAKLGMMDFAGSTVVHIVGGLSALMGAVMLGPRIGKFSPIGQPAPTHGKALAGAGAETFPRVFFDRKKYKANTIEGHSTVLATLGAFILFLGFFAFNGGSELQISSEFTCLEDGETVEVTSHAINVALIICNTIVAGATGGTTGLLLGRYARAGNTKWSLLTTINGSLAAMVALCSGANQFTLFSSFIIGILGALSYYGVAVLVEYLLIDDPVECIGVHFGGGFIGTISTGLFGQTASLFLHGNIETLGIQLLGILAVSLWTVSLMGICFYLCHIAGILRVSAAMEIEGLDFLKHGEPSWKLKEHGSTKAMPQLEEV